MYKALQLISIPLLAILMVIFFSSPASAANAHNFNAGRIIDDAIFTNSNAMSVNEIQLFLNSKVTCDTWGTKKANKPGSGNQTRAQWMLANRGLSTPLRCISDYKENPNTGVSNYSRNTDPDGAISAAQIIYNYSKQFNINPQVIIATLQKENSLILDEWPNTKQYREAMGFGCPDNIAPGAPACDPDYGSFSAQVYEAARHFRGYIDNKKGWWVPFNTGWNDVSWSPASSCGTGSVYIENRATVALYSYTPYQPNQAAKNAQYGIGDSCSSYGNRNFYMYFTDWFGSTYGSVNIQSSLKIVTESTGEKLFTGMPLKATFTIKNNTSQRQNIGAMAIATRDSQGRNRDFGSKEISLSPYETYQYEASRVLDSEDDYTFTIVNYRDGFGWSEQYPESIGVQVRSVSGHVQSPPTVESKIESSPSKIHVGEKAEISFLVKNNSSRPVDLGYFGLSVMDPDSKNADLDYDTVNTLGSGQTYSYNKVFIPKKIGTYSTRISSTLDKGITWSETKYPLATPVSNGNRASFTVHPNPTLTEGISLGTNTLREGDKATGTFKIKNFATEKVNVNKNICMIVRDQNNRNYDIGCLNVETLNPNQEIEFNQQSRALAKGTYKAYFSTYENGKWNDHVAFSPETGKEAQEATLIVDDGITMTQGISMSGKDIRSGEVLTGAFKVRNWSNENTLASNQDKICVIIRKEGSRENYDLGCESLSIPGGQERSFSGSRRFASPGKYNVYFATYKGGVWMDYVTPKPEGAEFTRASFTVHPNPTLTEGISLGTNTLREGDKATGTFKIKNFATEKVNVNKNICMIVRDQNNRNYDIGCLNVETLNPNQEIEFNQQSRALAKGTYKAYFSTYENGKWNDHVAFSPETGKEAQEATLIVK